MPPNDEPSFGQLLRFLRIRAGLSQNQLARSAGVDPAYVNRLERAPVDSTALPSRRVVKSLAEALDAGPVDAERMLVAAGLCPEAITQLGGWDACLGDVASVLADDRLSADDRAEFRELLRVVAARWRISSPVGVRT
jgi:transcriptional regulator with XRE-family HTH domain